MDDDINNTEPNPVKKDNTLKSDEKIVAKAIAVIRGDNRMSQEEIEEEHKRKKEEVDSVLAEVEDLQTQLQDTQFDWRFKFS